MEPVHRRKGAPRLMALQALRHLIATFPCCALTAPNLDLKRQELSCRTSDKKADPDSKAQCVSCELVS
jgi:hypothetical protein